MGCGALKSAVIVREACARPDRVHCVVILNLSPILTGQRVGIKQVSELIWLVTFMGYDLSYSTMGHVGSNQSNIRPGRKCHPCLRTTRFQVRHSKGVVRGSLQWRTGSQGRKRGRRNGMAATSNVFVKSRFLPREALL